MKKILFVIGCFLIGVLVVGCTTFRASVDELKKGEIVIQKEAD